MTTSTMITDAKGEITRTIRHEDGRQTIYTSDYRGREFFTLIGQHGQYQGTYPLERLKAQPK